MKDKFIILFTLFLAYISIPAYAEEDNYDDMLIPVVDNPQLKLQVYEGYYWACIEGDTVQVYQMKPFYVYPPLKKFKNKKSENFYWKTVRDVKKTLPYAKLIYDILVETYRYMETLPDDESRQNHLIRMEDELFKQYKPILKKFTYSQGKMLIKLVKSYILLQLFQIEEHG